MDKGHTFCEECNKIVQFDSRKKTLIGRIHGLDCEYYGTVALCPNCNSELYVAEYEDENLEALKDSYRKNNNILTLNQMNELLERYIEQGLEDLKELANRYEYYLTLDWEKFPYCIILCGDSITSKNMEKSSKEWFMRAIVLICRKQLLSIAKVAHDSCLLIEHPAWFWDKVVRSFKDSNPIFYLEFENELEYIRKCAK